MKFNDFLITVFTGLWNTNWYVVLAFIILLVFLLIALDSNEQVKYKGLVRTRLIKKGRVAKKTPTSTKEEICRQILQNIYRKEFKSIRPAFLRNPRTGRNLELDCYNPQLKIALEYDGKQHAEYTPFFHRNGPKDFANQLYRDFYKTKACKERGITLIRVPHFVPQDELKSFITSQLKKAKKL